MKKLLWSALFLGTMTTNLVFGFSLKDLKNKFTSKATSAKEETKKQISKASDAVGTKAQDAASKFILAKGQGKQFMAKLKGIAENALKEQGIKLEGLGGHGKFKRIMKEKLENLKNAAERTSVGTNGIYKQAYLNVAWAELMHAIKPLIREHVDKFTAKMDPAEKAAFMKKADRVRADIRAKISENIESKLYKTFGNR